MKSTKTKMVNCPDCAGEGHFETLVWLSYDGDQRWKFTSCGRCDGKGTITTDDLSPEELATKAGKQKKTK